MIVTLKWHECYMAATVGLMRHLQSIYKGNKDSFGLQDEDSTWDKHIEGACGELSFAKSCGVFWDGSINTFTSKADVGNIHVRTRSKSYYELNIRPNDKSGRYVLVRGKSPTYDVVGWFDADEAKTHSEWFIGHGGRPPAYFVPDKFLNSIDTIFCSNRLVVKDN